MTDQRPATTVKDPVCGMDVDPATAKHATEYQGQNDYFCSLMCRKAFEDNPGQYLGRQDAGPTASR
ncbi:MAG: Lead, cadmium, zinc and mercury transporting ATPase; Copper-translocating P-type ATPase [uncultured Thermomicrobiales bacterium]|uniref:Lead, cadmium, zinc and mercury transporting ATPase Copper-translocating P-type ATPase n=1 Tax=uncultured Thermomicrobiales bacterium TaxID=1645740 RepID=A0A6J4UTT5_9BACT|nr:MAG: Lead, cadmium, zinc and mercury transporting ATPase; Copper-translocating P-type ATPase [uncultured Thermomicrobiales bacterium]